MRQITITSLLLFLAPFSATQTSQRESFAHATVSYDWVVNHSGQKLRTFITRPTAAGGKVPVIFFVGWLSCDTMEYPDSNTRDGFGKFMRRLIDESGYATVRMANLAWVRARAIARRRTSTVRWKAGRRRLLHWKNMISSTPAGCLS